MLFAEAAAVSDDERVHEAAGGLAAGLRESWGRERRDCRRRGRRRRLSSRRSGRALPAPDLQAAIDELERLVGAAYRARRRPRRGRRRTARARLADHVSAASALLTAFECTGRLPYSMLAEELMQFAARTLVGCRRGRVLRRRNGVEAVRAQLRSGLGAVSSRRASRLGRVSRSGRRGAGRGLRPRCRTDSALARATSARGSASAGAVYGLAAADWHSAALKSGTRHLQSQSHVPRSHVAHSCPEKCRHAASDRLAEIHVGGRHRTSDDVLLGGGSDGGAVLRGDAIRSEGSAQPGERSLRAVEGPRRADPVLAPGPRPARSTARSC